MKLFCESTCVHEENCDKGVSSERSVTMKPNIACFSYREMVVGLFFFSQTTCYVEEKREENSTFTASAKLA